MGESNKTNSNSPTFKHRTQVTNWRAQASSCTHRKTSLEKIILRAASSNSSLFSITTEGTQTLNFGISDKLKQTRSSVRWIGVTLMAGTAWSQWHLWRSMERTMNCPVKNIWQQAALLAGEEVRRSPGHRALWCVKNRQHRKSTGSPLTHAQKEVSNIKESLPISEKILPTHYPISRKNKKNEPPWNSKDKGHVYGKDEAQLSQIRDKHICLCFSCSL